MTGNSLDGRWSPCFNGMVEIPDLELAKLNQKCLKRTGSVTRKIFQNLSLQKAKMAADNNGDGNGRGPLVALGVVVLFFVVGWLLARELYANGKLEDCLMSGRTNCAPIATH